MMLDHIALWTPDIEVLREYYTKYFNGRSNEKYINTKTGFQSYFITFESGSRLEIMQRPGIPENLNDRALKQHIGIIHLAFGVPDMESVIKKSQELEKAGFRILRGPRKTGDGYFEFETLDPDDNRIEVTTVHP
jgi:lactoylglutathione lyase